MPREYDADPLGANVPEAESLEQHPDPLAPFADTVETPVELEVLDRGQVTVEQRLVPEEPELAALGADRELTARRRGEPRDEPEQRRLARSVSTRDNEKAAAVEVEVDGPQGSAPPVALLEPASADHDRDLREPTPT